MKQLKGIVALLIAAIIIMPTAAFSAEGAAAVEVTLGVKETYALSAAAEGDYTIGAPDVISVSKKTVTALKTGSSTLKYTGTDGKQYSYLITVKKAPTSVTIPKIKTVYDNQSFSLSYTLSKSSAGKVTFSTSNKRVATVNKNGVIFAKHRGSVTITAKTYNGKKASCKLTVKQRVAIMTMSRERLALGKTSSAKLRVYVNPGAVSKAYKWTTSNKSVATVKGSGINATVTAKKAGKTTITCLAESGVKATCQVTVTKTSVNDSMKKQINAQPLYPEKTGYAPLDKLVQKKLASILKGKTTNYEKIKAVYDYEIKHFTYGHASYDIPFDLIEMYQSDHDGWIAEMAYETLKTNRGVCDNYAAVFTVMTRAIGFDTYSVGGKTTAAAGGWTGHAWNNMIVNNRYVLFDAQVEDNIARGGAIRYYRFALTDSAAKSNYKYSDRAKEVARFNHFKRTPDFTISVKLTRGGNTVNKTLKWNQSGNAFFRNDSVRLDTGSFYGDTTYTITVKKGGGGYYLVGNEAYFNGQSPYMIKTFSGILTGDGFQSLSFSDYVSGCTFDFTIS